MKNVEKLWQINYVKCNLWQVSLMANIFMGNVIMMNPIYWKNFCYLLIATRQSATPKQTCKFILKYV